MEHFFNRLIIILVILSLLFTGCANKSVKTKKTTDTEDMKPKIETAWADVNGDGKSEYIELERKNLYQGDIKLKIYDESKQKLLLEKVVLKNNDGVLMEFATPYLDNDGVLDILLSVHTEGVGYPNYSYYELYSYNHNKLKKISLSPIIDDDNITNKVVSKNIMQIHLKELGTFEYKIPTSKGTFNKGSEIGYYRGNQITMIDFDKDNKNEIKYEKCLKAIEVDDWIYFTIVYKYNGKKWKPIHLVIKSDRLNVNTKIKEA